MRRLSWPTNVAMLAACLFMAGCNTVSIPDVVGQTQDAATTAIGGAGLKVSKVSQQCSNTVTAGLVVSQDPAAGKQQSTVFGGVTLVVSTGECPLTVPNVVGQTQAAARALITGVNLIVGAVNEEYSDSVATGQVISQTPAANAVTTPGSAVNLVISLGVHPIYGSLAINNHDPVTNNPQVTLALTWSGGGGTGVKDMRFSDDGAHWTLWEAVNTAKTHTLTGGEGPNTVRAQFRDSLYNKSIVYSDYILLDTTPPTGSMLINNGAPLTASPTVTLTLSWDDGAGSGVTLMRFSEDGANWTLWETAAATRSYALTAANGKHTIRVEYQDEAGNYSQPFSDYIDLEIP